MEDVCSLLVSVFTGLVEVSGVDTCSFSSGPVSGYANKAETTCLIIKVVCVYCVNVWFW